MRTLFLTSILDLYNKDENGDRIPHNFGNDNGILDNLKKHIKNYDNFLYIASDPTNYTATNMYSKITFDSFNLTLPFKHYFLLDDRTSHIAPELVEKADFILLCGGHVPTQNKFFNDINLKALLKDFSGVVLGISAGSMNSAEIAYTQPEEEGEALDKNYKRYIPGLGLTDIKFLPHFDETQDEYVDGINITKQFLLPDSIKNPFVACPNGSYILQTNNKATLYGKGYIFENGTCHSVCEDNETFDLSDFSQKHKPAKMNKK